MTEALKNFFKQSKPLNDPEQAPDYYLLPENLEDLIERGKKKGYIKRNLDIMFRSIVPDKVKRHLREQGTPLEEFFLPEWD